MANYRRKTARFEWGASRVLFKYRAGDSLTALGAVFSRTGAAHYLDQNGVLQTAATGVARDNHWVNGKRTLLIEAAAATNILLRSDEFDHATWAKSAVGAGTAPAVAANAAAAPDGTTTADSVVFIAPGAGDQSVLSQSGITTVASSIYSGSIWVKAAAAADVGKILLLRHVALSAYLSITLTAAWQRVQVQEAAAGASSSFNFELRPSLGSSSGTVTALLWRGQLELGTAATSEIQTTTVSVTRNAESLYVPFTAPPQEQTLYVRGVEKMRANVAAVSTRAVLYIGNAASAEARLFFYRPVGEAGYRFQHDPVSAGAETANIGTATTIDSNLELRGVLSATGTALLGVSLDEAAESTNGPSSAQPLVGAWSDQRLYFGSFGAGNGGAFAFEAVAVAAGTHGMARMRALGAAGGTMFANTLLLGYPLDEAMTFDRPAEGSQMAFMPSGEADAWDAGTAYLLRAVAKWIPREDTVSPAATGWDGATGFRAFLRHCRRGNAVWFSPDTSDLAAGWTVRLQEPYDADPEPEVDMTRAVRLLLRSTVEFEGY